MLSSFLLEPQVWILSPGIPWDFAKSELRKFLSF